MAKNGSYFVSKFQNSFSRSFTHSKREGIMESLKEQSPFFIQLKHQESGTIVCRQNLVTTRTVKNDF